MLQAGATVFRRSVRNKLFPARLHLPAAKDRKWLAAWERIGFRRYVFGNEDFLISSCDHISRRGSRDRPRHRPGCHRSAVLRACKPARTGGRPVPARCWRQRRQWQHAVNDFRKLCGIEAYAPTDNVSELTARTNDEGWQTVFADWLKRAGPTARMLFLVFSVGGGDLERNVSPNLVYGDRSRQEHGQGVRHRRARRRLYRKAGTS